MFWHRVITITALGLLSIGIYATLHEEGQLVDSASAANQNVRKRVESTRMLDKDISGSEDFLESDTLVRTLEAEDGSKVHLIKYWTRLEEADKADPHLITLKLDDTQLYFSSYLALEIHGNDVTVDRNMFAAQFPNIEDYILINARLVGKGHTAYWFEMQLGLPDGTVWQKAYIGINEAGKVVKKGVSGLCDGGVQLSGDKRQLLTCNAMIDIEQSSETTFEELQVAIARFINDTCYVVVEDNADHYRPNARLMHTAGDTLFNFMYHGYDRGDLYTSGLGVVNNHLYLLDPHAKEVICFDLNETASPKLYSLQDLEAFQTLQESKQGLQYELNSYSTAALYINDSGKPVGYTLR